MGNKQMNMVGSVRERLIREGLVGEAISFAGADFFAIMLTGVEREQLRGTDTCQLMEDLFFAQIRWLFEGSHSLACLGGNVSSRLFRAMVVEDGVVSVELDDGSAFPVHARVGAGNRGREDGCGIDRERRAIFCRYCRGVTDSLHCRGIAVEES